MSNKKTASRKSKAAACLNSKRSKREKGKRTFDFNFSNADAQRGFLDL